LSHWKNDIPIGPAAVITTPEHLDPVVGIEAEFGSALVAVGGFGVVHIRIFWLSQTRGIAAMQANADRSTLQESWFSFVVRPRMATVLNFADAARA
jgi:hypothetical protein